jgi:hypothetical protein
MAALSQIRRDCVVRREAARPFASIRVRLA